MLRAASKGGRLAAVAAAAATAAAAGGGGGVLALSVGPAQPADTALQHRGGDDGALSERLRKLGLEARDALGFNATTRFSRTLYHGLLTSVDYKVSLWGLENGTDEYKAARKEVDLRAAKRILQVCQAHGGCFTKAGQYLSSLVKILPDEITDTLRVLQDSNPGEPFEDVRRVIQQDLGLPIGSLFTSFEPFPIAAASLAQVHKATTADGETVAVKVQYPRLEAEVRSDMWTLHTLASLVGALFPDWDYVWLLPEFKESITLELDFLQEATNAERIAALFSSDDRIHIPAIRWDLSSHRVLTMEFIEGAKVTNTKALEAQRINRVAVGETISTIFSSMVFHHGLIHCDAHAGNILIRKHPGGWWRRVQETVGLKSNFQVVLLDHGMYRKLNETFRYSYCQLWTAFLTREEALGRAATRALGLDEAFFELMSIISVNRTPRSKGALGQSMSEEERKAIREKYSDRDKYSAEALKTLIQGLPRDILFVLRSNALVRSLNIELGAAVGNRFRIFGNSACYGLSLPKQEEQGASKPPAHFLEEERDYSLVTPGVPGRVLQRRRKEEMLRMPTASVNEATAAEATKGKRRPLLEELRRQLAVADMRLRVWMIDGLIEWALWLRSTAARAPQPKGEELAEKQLHLTDDNEGQHQGAPVVAS